MTLQVALVGKDGIVVASDKKHADTSSGKRRTFSARKFRLADDKSMAVFYAKSGMATVAARRILKELQQPKDLRAELERIGEDVINGDELKLDSEVVFVTSRIPGSIFHLHMGNNVAQCDIVKDKVVFTGDGANAALFFTERYYQKRPIRELALLAAHTVLVGGRLNPGGISGLDIVFCEPSGITSLSEKSVAALRAKSEELDGSLGRSF